MKEKEVDLYESVIGLRINEVNLRWKKMQFFSIVNTALLAYSGSIDAGKWVVTLVTCPIGILISILWWKTIKAGDGWVEYWDEKLVQIELNMKEQGLIQGSVFSSENLVATKMDNANVVIQKAFVAVILFLWIVHVLWNFSVVYKLYSANMLWK